jgi:LCP family protein required for cell wall assembly
LYGLFLLFSLCIGTIFGWASSSSLLTRGLFDPKLLFFSDPRKAFDDRNVEVLLILGCDEDRVYAGYHKPGRIVRGSARSDMMMLARLDFAHNSITGLSIPRDTACTLPGFGKHKINAFYSIAGSGSRAALAQRAVEHLLPGVSINKVVAIDFDKFKELVDLVGGVDVTVPRKTDYDDFAGDLHIHFHAGPQHMAGHNAIEFIRFRHDREGDFGRQSREREFLLAVKTSALRNWAKLPQIAEEGKRVLGGTLTDDQVLALAMFSKKVSADRIKMATLPVLPSSGVFLKLDAPATKKLLLNLGFVEQAQSEARPATPSEG